MAKLKTVYTLAMFALLCALAPVWTFADQPTVVITTAFLVAITLLKEHAQPVIYGLVACWIWDAVKKK